MKSNSLKLAAIVVFVLAFFALLGLRDNTAYVLANNDDPAAVYKAKCAMCHSPKAEKSYDPAKPIEEQINIILKGKKGEKPPFMPAYEDKGMTAEQAKALAEYMKSLRTPAS